MQWPGCALRPAALAVLLGCTGCDPVTLSGNAFVWNRGYETVRMEISSLRGNCELLRAHGEDFLREDDFPEGTGEFSDASRGVRYVALLPGHAVPLRGCVHRVRFSGLTLGLIPESDRRVEVQQPPLPSQIKEASVLQIRARRDAEPGDAGPRPWDGLSVVPAGGMRVFEPIAADAPVEAGACAGVDAQDPRLIVAGPLPPEMSRLGRVEAVTTGPGHPCTELSFGDRAPAPVPAPAGDSDADAGVDEDAGVPEGPRADWGDFDASLPGPRLHACMPAALVPFEVGDVLEATRQPGDTLVTARDGRLSMRARRLASPPSETLPLELEPAGCGLIRRAPGSLWEALRVSVDGEDVPVGEITVVGTTVLYVGRAERDALVAPEQATERYAIHWVEVER